MKPSFRMAQTFDPYDMKGALLTKANSGCDRLLFISCIRREPSLDSSLSHNNTKSNMTFPSAVALNNTAVGLLRDGRIETAMELLNHAWNSLDGAPIEGGRQVTSILEIHHSQVPGLPLVVPPSPWETPSPNRLERPCDVPLSPMEMESPCPTSEWTHQAASARPQESSTSRLEVAAAIRRAESIQRGVVVHIVSVDASSDSSLAYADEKDLKASPNNSFYIFKRAFVFDFYGQDMNVSVWLRCIPHIPAVILYNAGLIFHRLAAENGSSATFHKALEMYQLSKFYVDKSTQSGHYVSELDILMLALANNMGHCYSHFNDVDETRNCLERMLVLFLFSSSTILLSKEEYDFYHINILFGVCRKPVVSPAA